MIEYGLPADIVWNRDTKIIHDHDMGFDSDDLWAHGILLERIYASVTNFYKPNEKKRINLSLLREFAKTEAMKSQASHIYDLMKRIYQGVGYYETENLTPDQKRERFLLVAPRWPVPVFGDPGLTENDPRYKCVYPYQTKAFETAGVLVNEEQPQGESQLGEVLDLMRSLTEQVLITATGPLFNLAEMVRREPALMKDKVKAIVMMNGTFMNPYRMGYNGALNMEDTQTVFNSNIPCIVVPSELCSKFKFPLNKVLELSLQREKMTDFGKMMLDVVLNWEKHRARKKNPDVDLASIQIDDPILADPLAALLAVKPEWIGTTRKVAYVFNHHLKGDNGETIHMLHPKAKELVEVKEDPNSNVYEVLSVRNPEEVQKFLEEEISRLFFPVNHKKVAL